jgi:Kef-type K+ transport system membrane component KefB
VGSIPPALLDLRGTLSPHGMLNLSLLVLQIAVILGTCRLLIPLLRRFGQPAVIAEMIAGVLLGPSCLGWLAPSVTGVLFPPATVPTLTAISQVGLVFFMFLIGWRLDVTHLRGIGRLALVTSLVSVIAPFTLGTAVAATAWRTYAPAGVDTLPFALFMGTAMSITAFPVLVRILTDRQLLATAIGTLAVACAAFNDAIGWVILAGITAIVRAGSVADAGTPLLGLAIYAAVMATAVRPALSGMVRRQRGLFGNAPSVLAVMLATACLSAYVTDRLGVHALFGAFFAGVIMPPAPRAERILADRVEPLTTTLLLPLFFASSGFRTALPLIDGWELWGTTATILVVAIVGKGVGSAVAARAMGMPWRDASQIGVLLNTRGLVELVVLNIGLDLGILSPVLFAMMVVMAFVTTLATSPLLSWLVDRRSR